MIVKYPGEILLWLWWGWERIVTFTLEGRPSARLLLSLTLKGYRTCPHNPWLYKALSSATESGVWKRKNQALLWGAQENKKRWWAVAKQVLTGEKGKKKTKKPPGASVSTSGCIIERGCWRFSELHQKSWATCCPLKLALLRACAWARGTPEVSDNLNYLAILRYPTMFQGWGPWTSSQDCVPGVEFIVWGKLFWHKEWDCHSLEVKQLLMCL